MLMLLGGQLGPLRCDPLLVTRHVGIPAFAGLAKHINPDEHAAWSDALASGLQERCFVRIREVVDRKG